LFALLSFCSIVTSRISPEFTAQREALHLAVVPSRYYTFVFFFWAGVLFISTRLMLSNKRRWPQFAALGSLAFVFTFGLSSWQIGEAANWRGYYRELDVAGSALIMHVDDPSNRYLTQVYPDPELRSRMSLWLESGGKALFAEKRATLPGIRIGPGQIDAGRCRGAIQSAMPLSDGVIRLTGWVLDSQNESPPRDVAFADSSGTIVGIGRSGLRRPDLKGSAGISSLDTIGWQGYARLHTKTPITAFGVLDGSDRYCQAGPSVSLGD
jgi:hypothetical protein